MTEKNTCLKRVIDCLKATSHIIQNTDTVASSGTKAAFTLAEVLITLAIIGIVAALTLPNIIANYRKLQTEVRLKNFYTNINQAIKMSEAKFGPIEYWDIPKYGFNTDEMQVWIEKYIAPEMKILQYEKVGSIVQIYLADGSKAGFFIYTNNTDKELSSLTGMHVYFYPFAKNKSDILGRDKFTFYMSTASTSLSKGRGIDPYKYNWDGTRDSLLNSPSYGCSENSNVRHYCTMLIQYDGWKISDDYPFKI